MKFYFCEGCGVRVTEKDIEGQRAKNKQLKGVYCSNCAVGVTTVDSLPMSNDDAKALLANEVKGDDVRKPAGKVLRSTSSTRTRAVTGPKRRPSSLDSSRTMRAAARIQPEPKSKSLLWIGAGVGLALIACVVLVASTGGNGQGRKKVARKKKPFERPKLNVAERTLETGKPAPKDIASKAPPRTAKAPDPEQDLPETPVRPPSVDEKKDTADKPPSSKTDDEARNTPDENTEAKGTDQETVGAPTAPEPRENKPNEKPDGGQEANEERQEARFLAMAETLARRQSAYRKLGQAGTSDAEGILKGLQSENRSSADLQARLARDLQIVGLVDEILSAVPKGVGMLKDGRAFTFHLSSGRTMDVGKNSRNTVKGLKGERIIVGMDMGGGTAEMPVELTRLKPRTRIRLGRMGLGEQAANSLHDVLAQWLLAQTKKENSDLDAIRSRIESAKMSTDQRPLAKHLLEVMEGMSRAGMAKRALVLIKEACAAKSWEEANRLLKKFADQHGESAFAARNRTTLEELQEKVDFGRNPRIRKFYKALENPSEDTTTLQRIVPGFIVAVRGRKVVIRASHRGLRAAETDPKDKNTPCVLRSLIKIPAGKTTRLLIKVSSGGGDWQLVVRVNGDSIFQKNVRGVKDFEIGLTRFAGRKVLLDLENKANGWINEHGFWHKVEVVSK